MKAADVTTELENFVDPEKAAFFPRFFKAGPGEYAEGDTFIGVTVPKQRLVAKKYRQLPLGEVQKLLDSPVHEHRLTGLIILTLQFAKADHSEQKVLYDFYLKALLDGRVNNWDLVDTSAHKIVGAYLLDKDRSELKRLYNSGELWMQRVAIVSCYTFIKHDDFTDILWIAESSASHEHDLIHKAVGWMLRELGKRDELVLRSFLDKQAAHMPRTMLRYAIEKLPEADRSTYLSIKRS